MSDRASQWTLDGPDWDFMERQKYLWNPLMDYWFRMDVGGWENIPEPPALLVGIHSGAPFVWDAWTVGARSFRFRPDPQVQASIEDGMDALARRRRLPMFG